MQATVEYTTEEFHQRLRTVCEQTDSSYRRGYRMPVFGSYERKYFYGKIRNGFVSLQRNSPFSRNPFRIDVTFSPANDNRTNVTYTLVCNQSLFWRLAIFPSIAVVVDFWLYIKTDLPVEGLLFLDIFLLLPMLWIPVENRRARTMLEVFKEEFQIE